MKDGHNGFRIKKHLTLNFTLQNIDRDRTRDSGAFIKLICCRFIRTDNLLRKLS